MKVILLPTSLFFISKKRNQKNKACKEEKDTSEYGPKISNTRNYKPY